MNNINQMKQFLEECKLTPNRESLEKVKRELERSEQIIKYNHILIRDNIFNSLEKKKAKDSIDYENELIEEASKIKYYIARILINK
jgi:hypothetical protein